MTRTPFLAANWKMFKTVQEAVFYAKEFRILVKDLEGVETIGQALDLIAGKVAAKA